MSIPSIGRRVSPVCSFQSSGQCQMCFSQEILRISSDQAICALSDCYGPFSVVAEGEAGYPEVCRFFLDTSRVSDNHSGAVYQTKKINVGGGCHCPDAARTYFFTTVPRLHRGDACFQRACSSARMDGEDHRQLLRDLRNYLESGSQPHGIINISRSMERQYDIFAPLNTEAITHS